MGASTTTADLVLYQVSLFMISYSRSNIVVVNNDLNLWCNSLSTESHSLFREELLPSRHLGNTTMSSRCGKEYQRRKALRSILPAEGSRDTVMAYSGIMKNWMETSRIR